jgi:hypothetical protein
MLRLRLRLRLRLSLKPRLYRSRRESLRQSLDNPVLMNTLFTNKGTQIRLSLIPLVEDNTATRVTEYSFSVMYSVSSRCRLKRCCTILYFSNELCIKFKRLAKAKDIIQLISVVVKEARPGHGDTSPPARAGHFY